MKILHLFWAALSVLLLASSGFAFFKPHTRRQCYAANGACKLIKCPSPMLQIGKCGILRKCCKSPM
ncbi:gallinacin-1 alpha-like [Podarcis lilfordi]|uniref:Gallinacin-1 alpha-like n=1 Tax=Podarcis lilfordi TaxID=74358 RepID=A0AA35K4H1_9SAUR|nr:gallinacin-1 alpha-like [Podarcis lilfordi]